MNRNFSVSTSATASIFPVSAILLLFALLAQPAWAEVKHVKATREQVAEACEAAGGTGYGYEASHGSYGCVTDIASIDCDESGNCTGEVFDDEDTARSTTPGQQAHLKTNRARRTTPPKLSTQKSAPTIDVRKRTNPTSRTQASVLK
jgi:hypothetical protein